jgi:hypothetical protein
VFTDFTTVFKFSLIRLRITNRPSYPFIHVKNPNSFEGIYVLQDLSLLDPDRVHELEDLIRDGDRDFGSSLGHAAKALRGEIWPFSDTISTMGAKAQIHI